MGDHFKDSTPQVSSVVNGTDGTLSHPSPRLDKVSASSQPRSNQSQASQNANSHKSNFARIEVAIPARSFDTSAYVDPQHLSNAEPNTANGTVTHLEHVEPTTTVPSKANQEELATGEKKPAFRIELRESNINRDEYQTVAETLEEPQHLSRKKGRQEAGASQGVPGESVDQRQRAETALNELRRRTNALTRATRAAFQMEPGFEHLVVLTPEQEPVMSGEEQKKMYTALQKVINFGCFDRVPVDDLSQLLKLCEPRLKEALSLELQVNYEWDDSAVETWVQQLSDLDSAHRAARNALRILTGGREDRQLYSESVIKHCVKVFQKTTDEVIIPIVELRNADSTANVFKSLTKFKKEISPIFVSCQKLLAMLADLVSKIPLADSLDTLEFVSSKLVFVENAYYEKDSIVGMQKFDGVRSAAMDVLCQVFLTKPEQRQGILNEILTSLSKLPVTKQGSRQFKIAEGGSIQPVSALFMRLVQASSASRDKAKDDRQSVLLNSIDGTGEQDADQPQTATKRTATSSITSETQGAEQPDVAIQDLGSVVHPLVDDPQHNASLIIGFLVQRAANSSKSAETPYRHLLDLCVEDLTLCLDCPDWPAAELLLRCLMSSMVSLFEGEKTAAPTKNMALEVLGSMTASISRLRSHVKKLAGASESQNSDELTRFLADLANQSLEKEGRPEQTLTWTGPYRIILESFYSRGGYDAHLAGATSFIMANWAHRVRICFENASDEDQYRDQELGRLAYRIRMMIEDSTWLRSQFEFNIVNANQSKLSYLIMLLGSPLCESFERILGILLRSMTSDQATVRSKSLKSVNQVLETDPSILDGNSSVVDRIAECARDLSSQVRESALGLIGSCIQLRPALELSMTPRIMDRFQDAGVAVRRRAMRLARDIYLRNHDQKLRSYIASGLLRRVVLDLEESVRDAARLMVEEIWFAPFYNNTDDTAAFRRSLAEHTVLIIRTVRDGGLSDMLDKVFQSSFKSEYRGPASPFAVCCKLVSNMFEYINNPPSEDPDVPSGRDALQVLTIFARAEPKLFTFEQIRLLKPQLASADLKNADDMIVFKGAVVILKCVLPQLSTVHSDFVNELKTLLVPRMGNMENRATLDELVACLRVILDLLHDLRPILSLCRSALVGLQKMSQKPNQGAQSGANQAHAFRILSSDKEVRTCKAYTFLLGPIAQHFNLDSHIDVFKVAYPKFKGDSVARLIIDQLMPFASSAQLPETRKFAIDGIAAVCQAWPRNFDLPKVYDLFKMAFLDQDQQLETIILRSFKEFLVTEEKRSEASAKSGKGEKKSLTVMGGTNYDDVASALTQRFLGHITRISLATQDHYALLALEVLGSINRQGLTHPKETSVTLITLETSANKRIAELAFQEHRALHEKQETNIEREYTKAVQSAYEYQRDVAQDTRGAIVEQVPQSKLHNMMDVLKISKMKNRQRFFEKLCGLVQFDFSKLETSREVPPHLDFTRFVVENMAFFEYQTVGELQTAVRHLEKIVSGVGATVAQAIESEIFNVTMDVNMDAQIQQQLNGEEPHGQEPELPTSVEPERLRHLATASIILLMIWEVRTYLRRLYGMGSNRQDSKAKALAKDLNRTPTKTQGVHWEKAWEELTTLPNGLQSPDLMMRRCKALGELMSIDSEFKIADEDDDNMDVELADTPSDGEDEPEARGRKRKGNTTPGSRKKRARSGSQVRKRGRPRKNPTDQDTGDIDSEVDWF